MQKKQTNGMSNSTDLLRDEEIYSLFEQSFTLQNIGDRYGLTRERIRQIILRRITKNILHKIIRKDLALPSDLANLSALRVIKTEFGRNLITEEFERIYYSREKTKISGLILQGKEKGIVPEKFTSYIDFANNIHVNPSKLKKFFPDIIDRIKLNTTIGHGGRKWSRYYLKCRMCGTVSRKHRSSGYCVDCYTKTEQFKDMQRNSFLKYREDRRRSLNKYQSKRYDALRFGGNRINAIERDQYKCVECGISTKKHFELYRQSLRVAHINSTNDNSLNNLKTLCISCCSKYIQFKRYQLSNKSHSE